MKSKLVYLVLLAVVVLATTRSYAVTKILSSGDQSTAYSFPFAKAGSSANHFVEKSIRSTPSDSTPSPADRDTGSAVRQAPDATMSASVTTTSQSLLALIAILNVGGCADTLPSENSSPRPTIHQILFRVIISPNAP